MNFQGGTVIDDEIDYIYSHHNFYSSDRIHYDRFIIFYIFDLSHIILHYPWVFLLLSSPI